IQVKFVSIFSFLFGLGLYIFMSRAEEKGKRVYRLFSRRLIGLALFGLIHLVFLWYGDILLIYAIAGFCLMLFYKRKLKTIMVWIVILAVVSFGFISIIFMIPVAELEPVIAQQQAEGMGKIEEAIAVYQHA